MKPILQIASAGMGNSDFYPQAILNILARSGRILATDRIAEPLRKKFPQIEVLTINRIMPELEKYNDDITVLVSGDCGFYSLANVLVTRFKVQYEIISWAGLNSMQYLLSKCNKSYHDVVPVSLHGKDGSLVPMVAYNKKIFLLTDNQNTVASVLRQLKESGFTDLDITVGQDLSYDSEKIVSGSLDALCTQKFSELAVIYIENIFCADTSIRLKDRDFIRGKMPMTKEHIRILSMDRLAIHPQDIVYDIGAGTGSVSIAAAYHAKKGYIYAIEKKQEAITLIKQNREKFKAYNMQIIQGMAPACFDGLPAPEKAFIGGAGGYLDSIIAALVQKNALVHVCINTISLESLHEAQHVLEKYKFTDMEISCVNCANSEKAGDYTMMKAENPIYIISGKAK